jgi:cation transport ATPase
MRCSRPAHGTMARMSLLVLRAIVSAVVALALAAQYSRAAGGTLRRRAFGAGALAFLALGCAQIFTLAGAPDFLALTATTVALTLIVVAVALLILAYQRGEMNEQLNRARTKIAEERRAYQTQKAPPKDDEHTS